MRDEYKNDVTRVLHVRARIKKSEVTDTELLDMFQQVGLQATLVHVCEKAFTRV